ncbi:MAG: hypothetical protein ACREO1_15180 [Arenimonas sp.]
MYLSTQLKRGYLGLIGLAMLSLGLLAAPDTQTGRQELVQKEFAVHFCKTEPKTRWKFASTPFDMPSLPSYKVRLCRA